MIRRFGPWTLCGILAAMLAGTIAAFVELATGRDIESFLPREWR